MLYSNKLLNLPQNWTFDGLVINKVPQVREVPAAPEPVTKVCTLENLTRNPCSIFSDPTFTPERIVFT